MSRALFRRSAQRNLSDLRTYLNRSSGNFSISRKFILRIRGYCDHLASLPFEMGRERPELAPNLRSATFEGYVIFFRYVEDRFEVVNIVEGHRDMTGYFSK
jgi:plasmid stabilization system protein ParE